MRQTQSILIHETAHGMLNLHLIHGHAAQLLLEHILQFLHCGCSLDCQIDRLAIKVPIGVGRIVRYANADRYLVWGGEGGDEVGFRETSDTVDSTTRHYCEVLRFVLLAHIVLHLELAFTARVSTEDFSLLRVERTIPTLHGVPATTGIS